MGLLSSPDPAAAARPPVINLTPVQARRFMVRTLGLAQPFADTAVALAYHGFIQLDPINVCGRMHDLILRNRVLAHREGDLLRHTHGPDAEAGKILPPPERRAFEFYAEVLCVLPVEAWPHMRAIAHARAARRDRWWGRLTPTEEKLARQILATIAERGPQSSDDIEHVGRSRTAWNSSARLAKVILEKLFLQGRVLIAARRGFRRVYDLPERVLPPDIFNLPEPGPGATQRWQVELKLRQRRLVRLNRNELAAVGDRVQPVRVGHGAPLYCLIEDASLLDAPEAENDATATAPIRLLAPLDPLIYDRAVTRRVWDFDYTWEVYTPPAKRVRGYYALPVLAGISIEGTLEPRADRGRGRLQVISRRVRRGVSTSAAMATLAAFLRLKIGC